MAAPVQTRRSHRKVRTGCLTCKARRKKCDEAKPSCCRCVAAGFKCDGYADLIFVRADFEKASSEPESVAVTPHSQQAPDVVSDTSSSHPSPWRRDSPGLAVCESCDTPATSMSGEECEEFEYHDTSRGLVTLQCQERLRGHRSGASAPSPVALTRSPNPLAELRQISDLEVHCFSYVQQNTVPRFAAYFDNSAWRVDLQDAALMVRHPALFKAVTALGAVHRRFCYGISREAFEYCFHAARLYEDAVKSLEGLIRSKANQFDSEDLYIISASKTILGIFQMFQGNLEASAALLHSAWRSALTAPKRLLRSESFYYAKPSSPRIISSTLYQLYCRATELFGEPPLTCSLDSSFKPNRILKIPERFESLMEMKNSLFGIIEEVWRHFRWIEDSWIRRVHLEPYEGYLHQWTSACMRTLNSGLVIEPAQVKAFNLLNMTRCVLCLSIQGNLLKTDRPEIRPIPHLPIFAVPDKDDLSEATAELCTAIDYLYTQKSSDMSHVRWMFQQTSIKHSIFSFEHTSAVETSDSRVNEMLNLWTIAKHVSETQENAVIEALKDVIPPNAVDIDIGDLWRESRKVMVRYYEPNSGAPGYRWVSQFWAY